MRAMPPEGPDATPFTAPAAGHRMLVANVHLLPLPGSTGYRGGGLRPIVDRAVEEARIAHEAGFDAVLIQDLGDGGRGRDGAPEVVACMTAIGAEIRAKVGCELGVNALPVGARTSLAVARAIGARFVRVKVYVGAVVTPSGIVEGGLEETLAFRAAIDAEDVEIVADVFDRTSWPLGGWSIAEAAGAAVGRGRADALVITGRSIEESMARVAEVRAALPRARLWCGGGSTPDNVRDLLRSYDGVIVGMGIKPGGAIDARFDPRLAQAYVTAARSAAGPAA